MAIATPSPVDSLSTPEIKTTNLQTARTYPAAIIGWGFWSIAALFYLYEYVLRVSPSVLTNELMLSFNVTSGSLGTLVSLYYLAYVPLQIPCGVIVDWLGPRRVVTFSAFLCALGTLIFAMTDNITIAAFARFIIGAGSACGYLCCSKVGADWLHPHKFAHVAAVTMMMGTLGGIGGGLPFAMISNALGWRQAMLIAAAAGAVIMVICYLALRDRETLSSQQTSTDKTPFLEGLRIISQNPQSWLIGFYGCLMYVPISAFAELWGTPYLMLAYGVNNEVASASCAWMFMGMAIGCPIGAELSNRIKSRIKVMSWSAIATMIPLLAVVYIPEKPYILNDILLGLTGLLCGGQILYFAAAKEISPSKYSGTAIGFTNALVMVSGLIFQPLLGHIIDLAWDGLRTAEGAVIYSVSNYQQAFMTIPVCMILAWLVMRFVTETYPENTAA